MAITIAHVSLNTNLLLLQYCLSCSF